MKFLQSYHFPYFRSLIISPQRSSFAAEANEVLESAKDSVKTEIKERIDYAIEENPDYDRDEIDDYIRDDIFEIVDGCVPIYNHEIMACASLSDIWTRESEIGPAFDGTPTLINITAGLIFEYLEEYAYEIIQEYLNEKFDD